MAASFYTLSLADRQMAVKTFALYFAEAARFDDIERLANAFLAGDCSQQWSNYSHLISRWGRVFGYALGHGLAAADFRGSVHDNLVAPVTSAMIAGYNNADPDDQISVPAPTCLRVGQAPSTGQ